MKRKSIIILPLLLSVVSCGGNGNSQENKKLLERTGSFYQVPANGERVPLLSELKVGKNDFHYRTVENEPLVPYFTLQEYANVFASMYKEGAQNKIEAKGDAITWILNVGVSPVFASEIHFDTKTVLSNGSFSSAYVPTGGGVDPSIYTEGVKLVGGAINSDDVYAAKTTSYAGFDLDPIKVENDYYLPLGLLDLLFSKNTGYSVYFDYKDFFLVGSSNYNGLTTPFKEKESDQNNVHALELARRNAIEITKQTYVAKEKDKEGVEHEVTYPVMPMYLRKYHRNSLYFTFESLYGLKYARGIKSMKEYFANDEHSEALLSDDPVTRGEAMNYLIGELADGHTSLRTNNGYVWHEVIANRHYGKLWDERLKLRKDLLANREEAYIKYDYEHANGGEEKTAILEPEYKPDEFAVRYNDDEDLAFFHFDNFIFATNAKKEDGSIREDVYKDDTFYYFARQFKEIKDNHKKVKNVVIDLSTNGGGIVIALMKILALISANNEAYVDEYMQHLNTQLRYKVSVDTNGDGKYDQEDVYGDDFKIYLLCSPFSFSCGNAYPFLAYKQNLATIIGARSGGGECSVDVTMLSSGMFVGHSSLTRIGYNNPIKDAEGKITGYEFEGDEGGAPVEEKYAVNYNYYYDFNYLANMIKANAQ